MDPRQVFEAYERLQSSLDPRFVFCPVCAARLETRVIAERPRHACPSCGYVHFINPAPSVVVLVVDDDRVLLCRRSATTSLMPSTWCLPGGHVEFDEDFLSAAHREVREETGLDVRLTSIISVVSNYYRPDRHSLVIVLLGEAIGGEAAGDGHEIDDVAWHTYGDPLPLMGFDADTHIIQRYFQTRLTGAPIDPRFAG